MPESIPEPDCSHPLSSSELRRWLRRDWALVFSHPEDFASYGFEADRWIAHVEEAFKAHRIRAVALSRHPDYSWVTQIEGRAAAIDLKVGPTTRFVAIVDGSLRVQRTFAYEPHDRLPSLLDLPAVAAAQRDTQERFKHADHVLHFVAATAALLLGALAAPRLLRAFRTEREPAPM